MYKTQCPYTVSPKGQRGERSVDCLERVNPHQPPVLLPYMNDEHIIDGSRTTINGQCQQVTLEESETDGVDILDGLWEGEGGALNWISIAPPCLCVVSLTLAAIGIVLRSIAAPTMILLCVHYTIVKGKRQHLDLW